MRRRKWRRRRGDGLVMNDRGVSNVVGSWIITELK